MEVLFNSSTKYYDYVLYKSYNLANFESDNRAFLWIKPINKVYLLNELLTSK